MYGVLPETSAVVAIVRTIIAASHAKVFVPDLLDQPRQRDAVADFPEQIGRLIGFVCVILHVRLLAQIGLIS